MNVLFCFLFCLCGVVLLTRTPDLFFAALLEGASKAASTCLALLASYAVWMGLIQIWEDCGIARKVARLVKPAAKKLLRTDDEQALTAVSMNFSVNLLGISGAATPYGIQAANLLDKTENAEFSSAMFFVLNATSLQLLPSSMVAVRTTLGSANPADIILPTLLCTLLSTVLGAVLTILFLRPKKQSKSMNFLCHKQKTKGVCTR